ncbi:MAG: hypothetical protein ACI30A_06430 [Paludibacteraceae bacterium]
MFATRKAQQPRISNSPLGGPTVADGQIVKRSDSVAFFSLTVLVVQTNVAQRNVCNTKSAATSNI